MQHVNSNTFTTKYPMTKNVDEDHLGRGYGLRKSHKKTTEKRSKKEMLLSRMESNKKSAKVSRERLKNYDNWILIQIEENKDKIHQLENTIDSLLDELEDKPKHLRAGKPSKSEQLGHHDRQTWFGKPF